MLLCRNPSPEKIQELIEISGDVAANWILDKESGDKWFWPSDAAFHANIAKSLHIKKYDKGIAIT